MEITQLEKSLKKHIEKHALEEVIPDKTPLWNHQKEAIQRAKTQDYFAFFFEVGCGKTRALIETVEAKFKLHGRPLRTLVLTPLIVVENFKREWKKFGDPKTHVFALTGANSKRMDYLKESILPRFNDCVLVTNYEILYYEPFLKLIREWGVEVFVADELHRLKDSKTKRTKAATDIADRAFYRYGLSGTPILNTQLDLFSQIRLLDRGKTFGSNFFVFRTMYFYDANSHRRSSNGYFPLWLPRPGIDEELKKKISSFTMSVQKKDCLDLPPLVIKELDSSMGLEQTKSYNSMKKDFIAYLNDKACVADLAITKALRLQQIVSGFIKVTDKAGMEEQEVSFKDNPRLDQLRQLLEDITPTAKVIVWATFKKNYQMIENVCQAIGVDYAMLHGEISNKQEQVDKFQGDEKCRVMIANPGAGGIGINLTQSNYSIYYSRSFSLEHDIQSEGRNYRGGSEIHDKVTRIDLVAKGTIDELILKILAKKKRIGDNILTNQEILERFKKEL